MNGTGEKKKDKWVSRREGGGRKKTTTSEKTCASIEYHFRVDLLFEKRIKGFRGFGERMNRRWLVRGVGGAAIGARKHPMGKTCGS